MKFLLFLQWLLCLTLLLIYTVFATNVPSFPRRMGELKTCNPPIPGKVNGSSVTHIPTRDFGRISDHPVSPPPKVRGSPSSTP